jgi:hypothetical protein
MQSNDKAHVTKPGRRPTILCTLLFLVAIGFAVAAMYMYWDETQNERNAPTPASSLPGLYTLAQVKASFDDQGLKTEIGRDTGRSNRLPGEVGQLLNVNGYDVYVFVCSEHDGSSAVAKTEAAFAQLDPSTLVITQVSGEEVGEQLPKHVFQGSNIITVMIGSQNENEDTQKI